MSLSRLLRSKNARSRSQRRCTYVRHGSIAFSRLLFWESEEVAFDPGEAFSDTAFLRSLPTVLLLPLPFELEAAAPRMLMPPDPF